LSPWLGLSVILFFAIGTADGVWGVSRNTLAQLLVPDSLRGRVMSVVMLATRGGSQLGTISGGLLVGLIGASPAVLTSAVIIGACVAQSWRMKLPDHATTTDAQT
jgi:MFS-type transporter involved in bile tolerance (Atg22 family)